MHILSFLSALPLQVVGPNTKCRLKHDSVIMVCGRISLVFLINATFYERALKRVSLEAPDPG